MDKPSNYPSLINGISTLIEQGRRFTVKQINTALVATYWLIGKRIVEYEQKGQKRAEYGEATLKKLSGDLSKRFGKGFGYINLNLMRQFFLAYPPDKTLQTVSEESTGKALVSAKQFTRVFPISWSHYCLLLRIEEPFKKEFYEAECLRGNWSVRQLDRQIQSMLYERTALSKHKLAVIAKANKHPLPLKPEDEIKDPYILEFLNLKDEYSESQLEEALIKHLEKFLLELGTGFTFAARQKRIALEGRHYRLDLLLYHRRLKCLVAIDLKIGELTHADAGQMNLYLNYLKDKEVMAEENDPIGIILCSDKMHTVVEYALGGMNNRIFASKYKLKLPDPQLLKKEIEAERQRLIEMRIVEEEKNDKN